MVSRIPLTPPTSISPRIQISEAPMVKTMQDKVKSVERKLDE